MKEPRLIDANALLYVISPAVEPGGKPYDPDIPASDMRSYIHDMPTIDAIPVEWLKEKRDNEAILLMQNTYGCGSAETIVALNYVLALWRKEKGK